MNSLRRLQNGSRVSQYFARIAFRGASHSFVGRIRARPANSGPVTVPRIVQGATLTRGLFRIRLYFHESLRVLKYSLPASSANHTGVRTAEPSFLKVVSETHFTMASCCGMGIVKSIPVRGDSAMCGGNWPRIAHIHSNMLQA